MAQLGQKFNAQDHDTEQRDFSPLPAGIYQLEVTASDVVPTNDGTGTGLKLTYDVVAPDDYKGRKIFSWINLENQNAQSQEIGQRELASLCRAVQVTELDDSEQLHFLAFTAKVAVTPARTDKKTGREYGPGNKIARFYYPDEDNAPEPAIDEVQPKAPAANDNRPAARAAANQNTPAAARPAGAKPWAKKSA